MPEFAWPWVVLALPLPWLLRHWLQPLAPSRALHLPQPGAAALAGAGASAMGRTGWVLGLGWLCLLCAAARPQWVGPPQAQMHSGRALMLAVDLSGSMRTPDMTLGGQAVSRFTAVQAIAGDFISRRDGDELGLILFGTRAFLVTPLTPDLSAVRAQLHGAAIGLAGTETAIGDAIGVAVKRLSALPQAARVLVLLTDGVNNAGNITPQDAARAAAAAKVRIYAIGIGATRLRVPDFFGSHLVNPSAELDARMLTHIATMTGGKFFRATDSAQLAAAYRAIDALEPLPQHAPALRPRRELFRWPLLAGMALLLVASLTRGGVWRWRRPA